MTEVAFAALGSPATLGGQHIARLVNGLPVIVWSTDGELRVTSRYGGGLAQFGLSPGVGDLRHVTADFDPAAAAPVIAAHRAALDGESAKYETTVSGRAFSARVEPLIGANGRIVGVVGFAFDVTDRRESETRLRAIIETEPECVKLVDANGLLLDINPAGLAMIEADSIEQVRGLPIEQLVTPEHRAAINELRRRVFTGGSGTLEYELVGIRGTRRWLDTHAVPLRGPAGTITALLAITRDVTQRKQAEQALRESEERLQLVTRATNDAVWDWDLATNAVWWGSGFETLFGYAREEIEPGIESWYNRLHPEDRERVITGVRAAIDGGSVSWSSEYRFRRRDGSYADVHDRGYVIHAPLWGSHPSHPPRPVRMVGSMMDVTERKRAEAQLQASRTSLRLLAARHQDVREHERTRIAREIHDSLGQALTALKLQLAAAHDAAARGTPGLPERLSETAQMVDDLVKGVRRIATELRPPILDQLGLPAAIEWLAQDFTRRTGLACGATVCPPDAAIPADLATALFRIVQEALTNVARHADAARVDIALDVKSDVVFLEVTDDGGGITVAAASEPTSLGILGMRERAAAQGGVLEVGPRAQRGTRVAAWFPPLHPGR